MLEAQIFALLAIAAAASYGFARPSGAFRVAAILAFSAVCAPFVLGFAAAPFLGSGAGMGAAFILVGLAALLGAGALFMGLGAGVRLGWNALRRAG